MNRLSLFRLDPKQETLFALIAVWTGVMIAVPILRWAVGDAIFPADVAAGVLAQALASLSAVRSLWGWRRLLMVSAVLTVGAWLVEYVGHTTGFPFGAYDYTHILQPQLGGVPLLIPLAWLMMLPPAWAVAHTLTHSLTGWRGRIAFIVVSAFAFTAWDFFLDPQMVMWRLWVWVEPGAVSYFGIPWSNYAGWLLTSSVLTAIAMVIAPVRRIPIAPLMTIYGVSWFLETFGLSFFWGLTGPGFVGGVVMGVFLFAALGRAFVEYRASLKAPRRVRAASTRSSVEVSADGPPITSAPDPLGERA